MRGGRHSRLPSCTCFWWAIKHRPLAHWLRGASQLLAIPRDFALGAALFELGDRHLHAVRLISIDGFRQAAKQTVPFRRAPAGRRVEHVSKHRGLSLFSVL